MSNNNSIFNNYISEPARFADCVNIATGCRFLTPDMLHDIKRGPAKNYLDGRVPIDNSKYCHKFYGLTRPEIMIRITSTFNSRQDRAIAIKSFISDAYTYDQQLSAIRKYHKRVGDFTNEHILMNFTDTDHIIPTLNIYVYNGETEWISPKSTHELMNLESIHNENPLFNPGLIANYHLHILDIRHLPQEQIDLMTSDLRHLCNITRLAPNHNEILDYIVSNKDVLSDIDETFYLTIAAMADINELIPRLQSYRTENGHVSLIKAFIDIYLN